MVDKDEKIEVSDHVFSSFKNKLMYDLQFYACQYLSGFIDQLKLLLSGDLGKKVLEIEICVDKNRIVQEYNEYVEHHGLVIDSLENLLKTQNLDKNNTFYPTFELRALIDSAAGTVSEIEGKYRLVS